MQNKTKPNIQELIPKLSVKGRIGLLLKDCLSQSGFLTEGEKQLLTTFKTEDDFYNFRKIFFRVDFQRLLLVFLFLDTFNEFRYKAAALSFLYFQINQDMTIRLLDYHLGKEKQPLSENVQKLLWLLKKVTPLETETDLDKKVEQIVFKEEIALILKEVKRSFYDYLEQTISMREAIRRFDSEFDNPPYPSYLNKKHWDDCIKEAKAIQKKHNNTIFGLLKRSCLQPDFDCEVKDFDDYIIKTPKINEKLVKDYLDLAK